jgi:histidinol-phosphate aminotransferase
MKLPDKLNSFKPYPAMPGGPAVRMDGNESCFALPPDILGDIAEAVRNTDLRRYPDPYASEVCALAEKFWTAPKDSAVAGNGSDELISIALNALIPRGGKLLVCDPDFSMYRFYAGLCELEIISLERFSGVPCPDEVAEKGRSADAVILSNPCNPTGQASPREDMLRIAGSLDCPVLLDEAYMDFHDGGRETMMPYIERYDNLVILKTCSKNLALAGIRLGFAFSGSKLRDVLRSVKSPYNVSALAQAAGAAALRRPDWLRDNAGRLTAAKDKLYRRLCAVDGLTVTDTAANFVLVSVPDAESAHMTLRSRGVCVRLVGGILRISAGTDEETDILIDALEGIS